MVAVLSHLSPIPKFPEYTGPYPVGTVDVEIPVTDISPSQHTSPPGSAIPTIALRIFYPCSPPKHSARPVRWIQSPQRSIVSSYGRFLGAGSVFSNAFAYLSALLYYTTIPAHRDAPLLIPENGTTQWPVTVFSHGLGGTRNSYSHFCGSLAAHGVVVVAPDHRDGSAPIAHIRATATTEASTVAYRHVSHAPSKQTYDARDEQLRVRLWELGLVHEALRKMHAGETLTNLAIHKGSTSAHANDANTLRIFRSALSVNESGSMTFAGHSFGAATAVQFVKSVYWSSRGVDASAIYDSSSASASLKSQISPSTPVILLDPWGLPMTSPATKALWSKPLPCFASSNQAGGSGVLAILSEAFFKWQGNLNEIKRALSDPQSRNTNRPGAHIFYPSKSAHLSQSDFGLLFPNVTKYIAKAAEPVRTMTLNVRAALEVMRQVGIPVADTSRADMETAGDSADEADTKGDWKILSAEEGAVRGWIALSADDKAVDRSVDKHREKERLPKEMTEMAASGTGELGGVAAA